MFRDKLRTVYSMLANIFTGDLTGELTQLLLILTKLLALWSDYS